MTEAYITLQEAAELEQRNYKNFKDYVSRQEKKGTVRTVCPPTVGPGKPRKLIAVSSLSRQAQERYIQKSRESPPQEPEPAAAGEEIPWYVTTDLNWYMEHYKDDYNKAIMTRKVVEEFLEYRNRDRTRYAGQYAAQYLDGASARTLFRLEKLYREARSWAAREEAGDGCTHEFFTVLALARKPIEKGRFPSLTDEQKNYINRIWFNENFARNQNSMQNLYEDLEEIYRERREELPSYSTVTRYINWMMTVGRNKNAHDLAKKGERDYRNQNMVKTRRNTKALKVMEVVMGDEHTFDCWVSYTHPNGKVSAIKPVLVAWVDVRTRTIMGDIMCKTANSEILKQSVLKMIYQEHGGVPEWLFIDNGKDYTARTMTGRSRKERTGNELAFDDQVIGFYKSIGIRDDHRALPYQPWSKGQIERFFRTVCEKFSKRMASYTGTLTGAKTDAKVHRDIQQMLKRGELLTLEEFYEKWTVWLQSYHRRLHRGLKEQGEQYTTPYELWEHAEHYEHALPARSYCTMLMLKSESARVGQTGIRRFGFDYTAPELCDYTDRTVDIKYDPEDITGIYVFDRDTGKLICEAVSHEMTLLAPKLHQQALVDHRKMQAEQIKRDRERLEELRRPIGERSEEYAGHRDTVGGVDIIRSAGKTGKKGRIVSMPEDRTFRTLRGVREEPEDNLLKKDGLKVLAELEALNAMNQ